MQFLPEKTITKKEFIILRYSFVYPCKRFFDNIPYVYKGQKSLDYIFYNANSRNSLNPYIRIHGQFDIIYKINYVKVIFQFDENELKDLKLTDILSHNSEWFEKHSYLYYEPPFNKDTIQESMIIVGKDENYLYNIPNIKYPHYTEYTNWKIPDYGEYISIPQTNNAGSYI